MPRHKISGQLQKSCGFQRASQPHQLAGLFYVCTTGERHLVVSPTLA
nr:MAG TPA_asm: hypothetical protein [Caudoviricetes sp.]